MKIKPDVRQQAKTRLALLTLTEVEQVYRLLEQQVIPDILLSTAPLGDLRLRQMQEMATAKRGRRAFFASEAFRNLVAQPLDEAAFARRLKGLRRAFLRPVWSAETVLCAMAAAKYPESPVPWPLLDDLPPDDGEAQLLQKAS